MGMEKGMENVREQITNMEEEVKEIQMRMNRLLEQLDDQHQVYEKLLIKLEAVQRNVAPALIAANMEIQFKDLMKTTMTTNWELKSDKKRLLEEVAELKHELDLLKTKFELADNEENETYDDWQRGAQRGSDIDERSQCANE